MGEPVCDNTISVRRYKRRQDRGVMLAWAPAIFLIMLIVVLPVLWLFGLSVFDDEGAISPVNYIRILTSALYLQSFIVTFEISLAVTALCAILGYPVAYMMLKLPRRLASAGLICVLLPFWTSSLVRSYAWLVLLQRNGLVNHLLVASGVIHSPVALVNNLTGSIIGMTHVMLPMFILPLYGSLRSIDLELLRGAASLGSSPAGAFWKVFFPMSLPGLFTSIVMVFIICLGFYVTPALLGGGHIQMLAQRIQTTISLYGNWGAASALGVVLLALAVAAIAGLARIVGLRRVFSQ